MQSESSDKINQCDMSVRRRRPSVFSNNSENFLKPVELHTVPPNSLAATPCGYTPSRPKSWIVEDEEMGRIEHR